DSRSSHIPTHAPQARATVALGANAVVPRRTAFNDMAHIGKRFDVVDDRGHTERSDVGRKWGFDAGIGTLAFQRFNETGFLAADVGSGSTVQEDLELHTRTQDIFARLHGGVCLVYRR